jgi:predicted regulator of Ras-like GTPase activity (Roadblock/LC7/MglB family)
VLHFIARPNLFSYVTQPQIFSECANGPCGVVTYLHKSKIVNCGVDVTAQLNQRGLYTLISQEKLQGILSKIKEQEGVRGVVVTNMDGLPLSSDLDPETTENVAAIITSLVGKALDAVRELQEGSLSFLTLDTTKGQINIAPEVKEGLILVVLKNTQ